MVEVHRKINVEYVKGLVQFMSVVVMAILHVGMDQRFVMLLIVQNSL